MSPFIHGAPLALLAEFIGGRGWQLVPTQWHRNGTRAANTPVKGVTGSAPFYSTADMVRWVGYMKLHLEGGPDCTGDYAKPAVRPPLHVVGFDVDDGYAGKSGGDTLVEAEMMLGPLPGTYSVTARGQWSPSRRKFFRIPEGLLVPDSFFTEYGGCIETIRTGHRYSWTAPAIHTRKGQVVGPVLWYDPDHEVTDLPHVDELAELPASWVQAIRQHNAAKTPEWDGDAATIDGVGEARPVTEGYADGVVAKLTQRLHGMPAAGGEFRSTVYGLAAALTRRHVARQCACDNGGQHVMAELAQVFAEHPHSLVMDADDVRWATDGIEAGAARPWRFEEGADWFGLVPVPTQPQPTVENPLGVPGSASLDELATFFDTYTRYGDARRLGRRKAWAKADPAHRLGWHARCLVEDALTGHYPAKVAGQTITELYQHHGGQDEAAPLQILAVALGAILNAKVSA